MEKTTGGGMNSRIQELALESGAWHQIYGDQLFMHDHNFDIEMFARLIIAGCGVALNPPVQVRDAISRGQAYNLIKKHFGVEE
jgi:DNA-binding transcriptional LysR family regulator